MTLLKYFSGFCGTFFLSALDAAAALGDCSPASSGVATLLELSSFAMSSWAAAVSPVDPRALGNDCTVANGGAIWLVCGICLTTTEALGNACGCAGVSPACLAAEVSSAPEALGNAGGCVDVSSVWLAAEDSGGATVAEIGGDRH